MALSFPVRAHALETADHRDRARAQRGVVLFVSLIMLVVLTMAGLAVMRGVSAGVQITRNLVFKQGATASADRGIEAARKWLIDNKAGTTLDKIGRAHV